MAFSHAKRHFHTLPLAALILALAFVLSGCANVESEAKYPTGADRGIEEDVYAQPDSIFGKEGLTLFSGRAGETDDSGGTVGIGVNSYLWRASLNTVSFMPLASADPFGGVILTDWYAPPETPDERFKLNVFILDRQLRSDGIQVKVFHQVNRGGTWRDAPVSEETARQLEDTILTRARQMRVRQIRDR